MHTVRRSLSILLMLLTLGWAGAAIADDFRALSAEIAVCGQADDGTWADSGTTADQPDAQDSPGLTGRLAAAPGRYRPIPPALSGPRASSTLPQPAAPPPRLA